MAQWRIESLEHTVRVKDQIIDDQLKDSAHREEQLRPYLYNEIKEHEEIAYNEPLPKMIKKFLHHAAPIANGAELPANLDKSPHCRVEPSEA